jgi:hypothetical protein
MLGKRGADASLFGYEHPCNEGDSEFDHYLTYEALH